MVDKVLWEKNLFPTKHITLTQTLEKMLSKTYKYYMQYVREYLLFLYFNIMNIFADIILFVFFFLRGRTENCYLFYM